MTVIAWDGKTIAADRQATSGSLLVAEITKIKVLDNGVYAACAGTLRSALQMLKWFECGANHDEWPIDGDGDDDNYAELIVIDKDGTVSTYENSPFPIMFESPFHAWGNGGGGKAVALGALAMGADAIRAVEIACKFDASCGIGIDAYDVFTGLHRRLPCVN